MNALLSRNKETDSELVLKLRDCVKWDKRVSIADLSIVVRGGVVIVSGFVDTSYKKNAALEVISQTEGVWSIEDRIVVPVDYYRTDEEILNILESQIDEMIKIGGEHIEVDVAAGIVKLEGEVFRPRLKAMADSAAWELSGVRDVLNFIEIKGPPYRIPLSNDNEYNSPYPEKEMESSLAGNLKEVY